MKQQEKKNIWRQKNTQTAISMPAKMLFIWDCKTISLLAPSDGEGFLNIHLTIKSIYISWLDCYFKFDAMGKQNKY